MAYFDPYVSWTRRITAEDIALVSEWRAAATVLNYLETTALSAADSASRTERMEGIARSFSDLLSAAGRILVSPAEARPGGGYRGNKGNYHPYHGSSKSRGKGSNPRQRPLSRNRWMAQVQLHSRRQAKTRAPLTFKGIKIRFIKHFREHMDPGHGVKGSRISGAHTPAAFDKAVRKASGEYRFVKTHPADKRIEQHEYRLPNKETGALRPWQNANPKTIYKMSDEDFMIYVRQALKNAIQKQNGMFPGDRWSGSTKNGIKMEGFVKKNDDGGYDLTTAYFEKIN